MLIENKSSEHDAVDSSNVLSNEEQQESKPFEEALIKDEEELKS
jgi:hypothetical protein